MKCDVLMVLAPSTDPGPYRSLLESSEIINKVNYMVGGSDESWDQAIHAFSNGYSVVVTELLFEHSQVEFSGEHHTADITFSGYELIKQGYQRSRATNTHANYVVLSEWDHPNNIFETYRRFARAFISKRHPIDEAAFVDAVVNAAASRFNYPNLAPRTKNIAIALSNEVFGSLSLSDLNIVDLLVNELSTKQLQDALGSSSVNSTNTRVHRILNKVGVQSREDLIAHAIDVGMVRYT